MGPKCCKRLAMLLHSSVSFCVSCRQAMESLVDDGLVRSIGISNFNVSEVDHLLSKARIPPAVNQVELHPLLSQRKLVGTCARKVGSAAPIVIRHALQQTCRQLLSQILHHEAYCNSRIRSSGLSATTPHPSTCKLDPAFSLTFMQAGKPPHLWLGSFVV